MTGWNYLQSQCRDKSRICALGELLLEMLPENPQLQFEDYGWMLKSPSGAAGIFACAAAALGGRVGLVCRIGTDAFSRFALNAVQAYGVDISQVTVNPDRQLGLAFVEQAKEQRNFIYYRHDSAGSTLSPAHIDCGYIAASAVLHFPAMLLNTSDSMRETCLAVIKVAKSTGVLVSVDPNWRRELAESTDMSLLRAVIAQADIVTPSEEEALFITGEPSVAAAAHTLLHWGPQVVAITRGELGVLACSTSECVDLPGVPVEALDTVGAGDTFAAAFLVSLLEKKSLAEAADFANRAAALKVTKLGAIGCGLPLRREVDSWIHTPSSSRTAT